MAVMKRKRRGNDTQPARFVDKGERERADNGPTKEKPVREERKRKPPKVRKEKPA